MNWAVISTVLVGVHLVTEYAHYIIEFLWGRKDKKILTDILKHRKSSRKSEMLVEIVKDLKGIKKHLGAGEGEKLSDLIQYVDSETEKIDKDPRFHYPTAVYQINAPLAFIQQDMESRMSVLKRVRKLIDEVIKVEVGDGD